MANPHRGQVSLVSGSATYILSFSVNALCALEEALDIPVSRIGTLMDDADNLRMSTMRAVVWSALQDHHEGLDEKAAGLIISAAGIGPTMQKIGEAFQLAFPKEAEATVGKPKAPAGG